MFSALDLRLGFALLRCKEGLDFSEHIASEQQIIREVPYSEQEEEGKKGEGNPRYHFVPQDPILMVLVTAVPAFVQ